ncbi:MAG: glycosyltransferase [Patescibacteria group bacterium]
MRICYFGNFNPNYSRNRVIIRGLQENGVEILICRTTLKGLKGLWDLFKKHAGIKNKYDILIVGYSDSRLMVPFAKLISGKKIIWDAFYSLYDSWVFDRKLVPQKSLKAGYYWFLDWFSCTIANLILLDSNVHIDYFSKTFIIPRFKFLRVFIGADSDLFFPTSTQKDINIFLVHFHGNFVPLQGMEYIIKAAGILRNNHDIRFQIVGGGQDYQKVKKIAVDLELKNISWLDRIDYENLSGFINRADVCLGGFSNSQKARMVSMNKLFEYMACGKAIITGDSPSLKEILIDGESVIFSKREDPEDISFNILRLKKDEVLRKKLGDSARDLFNKKYTPKIIAEELIGNIQKSGKWFE